MSTIYDFLCFAFCAAGVALGFVYGRRRGYLQGKRRHQHPLLARYWDNTCGD